jgi:hypothetical protein
MVCGEILYDIFTFSSGCHNDDQIKDEVGGARSTRGAEEKYIAYRGLLGKIDRRPLVSPRCR